MARYDTFIVRVWQREDARWASQLEHLQGRESWRCADVDTLLASLRHLIEPVEVEEPGAAARVDNQP